MAAHRYRVGMELLEPPSVARPPASVASQFARELPRQSAIPRHRKAPLRGGSLRSARYARGSLRSVGVALVKHCHLGDATEKAHPAVCRRLVVELFCFKVRKTTFSNLFVRC